MSESLYQEAIAEAKDLRRVAEQNAKNAIIEAVTPKIRQFIEDQLLKESQDESHDDSTEVLESVVQEMTAGSNGADAFVGLDETAIMSLVNLLGGTAGKENIREAAADEELNTEILEVLEGITEDGLSELVKIINRVSESNKNKNNQKIVDENFNTENTNMSAQDDVLYEIDLNELQEEVTDDSQTSVNEDDAWGGNKRDSKRRDGKKVGDVDHHYKDYEMDEDVEVEGEEEEELRLDELSLEALLNEATLRIELGDVEIDPSDLAVILMEDEEEDEVDVELGAEEEESSEEEEIAIDTETEEMTDEVFEIDEEMLRNELSALREAAEMTKQKGIKKDMADLWGGKGSGKSGDDFGGGKRGKDPLDVKLNALSEAYKKEKRSNRSLKRKLNEYRGAMQTLREQLTELNLFNAKLLYVNKLLQNKDVSSAQRRSIIESLDNARSLREVKLLYTSLTESLNKPKSRNLSESSVRKTLGSSSRTMTKASATGNEVSEVNRWAKLAGIK